jgi:lysophospholipase L1-like esterase
VKTLLSLLLVAIGLLLGAFVYQQAVVEGSFGPAALVGVGALSAAFLILFALFFLSGTRFKNIVNNVLLTGASVVLTYLAVDFLAGWALIVPLSPPLVRDQVRHHVMVPNSYSELRQRDFAYIQRVNNLGLRGADTTLEKPAGTFRILMLGDSFTMGKGVEDDETFVSLVGQALQEESAACGGPRLEVLNGGVDSYSPILSYLQLKTDLIALHPDVVMLNLDNSDLAQETVYRRTAVFGADSEPLAVPTDGEESLYERSRSWIERHMFITRLILVYVNRAFDHSELTVREVVNELVRDHVAHTMEGDIDRTAQWTNLFDSLRRIDALTTSAGADFLLATYPWAQQVSDDEWVPGRQPYVREGERPSNVTASTIRRMAAASGFDVVETLPAFLEYHGSDKLYFDYDPHWTPAGHRVMAAALTAYLKERYLAQWCGAP